jgi:thiol-disulfide isomerase/thioredoxin
MVFVLPETTALAAASPAYTITEYFAKSCPHCVHMAPVWKAAAAEAPTDSEIGSKVEWVQKECYGDNWAPGKDFDYCQSKGVGAFPTIILNDNASHTNWTSDGISGNSVAEKAQSLLDFVKMHVHTNDVKVSSFGIHSTLLTCITDSRTPYEKFINFI